MLSYNNISGNNINNNVITTYNITTTTTPTTTTTTTPTTTPTTTTTTKSKKNFEYKSNIEIDGWWHTEIRTSRELKYYINLAEISGCKFEQFVSFTQFLDFLQRTIIGRYLNLSNRIRSLMEKKKIILKKNQFRLIEAEVNKTRRIRSIKINRLGKDDLNKFMLLVQASKNKLPTIIYQIILKEFVGLEFKSGCAQCKKANRPFDIIISHNSHECKFTHKHLHCVNCSTSSFKCINHTTDKCYNYCSTCRTTIDFCSCDDDHNDDCDDCGRPNTHCVCGFYSESDDDESRGDYCDDCGNPHYCCRC